MARRKLSEVEAFEFYVSSGPGRSYRATAERFGVSVAQVKRIGAAHHWAERVEAHEARAAALSEAQIDETLDAMNRRHLAALWAIQDRATAAVAELPVERFPDAVRALAMAVEAERGIRERATAREVDPLERRPVLRLPDVPAGLDVERWRALFDGDADAAAN